MEKTLLRFLNAFILLSLTSCATQEPAVVEYATKIGERNNISSTENLYDPTENIIEKRDFGDIPTETKNTEGYLVAPNSKKLSQKYITEDGEPSNVNTNEEGRDNYNLKSNNNESLDDELSNFKNNTDSDPSNVSTGFTESDPISIDNETSRTTKLNLLMPAKGKIISKFGDTESGVKVNGINIEAPFGSDVIAAADGEVVVVKTDDVFGNLVIIKHSSYNIHTAYAHLDKVDIQKGQKIYAGAKIGIVGKTGKTTKPILHFAVREANKPVDPLKYFQN